MASPLPPVVVWLRDDLRVSDNPALRAAIDSGAPVLPVYVHDDSGTAGRPLGGASRWWLHHSLSALDASLQKRGSRLVLRQGRAEDEIAAVLHVTGAHELQLNRRFEPSERAQDDRVRAAAEAAGVAVTDHLGSLLHEPGDVLTGDGGRFGVFTPFWRAMQRAGEPRAPLAAPTAVEPWPGDVDSVALDDLGLLPTRPDWSAGLAETWTPGEKGAQRRLDDFVRHRLDSYADHRDNPAVETTSRLSPHLKFGEISPYQLWHRVRRADVPAAVRDKFLAELGWREFDYDLLAGHGDLATVNVHRDFDAFPWADVDDGLLLAWQQGRTGFPLVDAGMRQLWQTGWMHNRVRMVTASFLIKNLHYDWRIGERWFWDTLVDADPANNTAQWQWVAGSGADAAPFFRIFNPVTQSEKFDAEGEYIIHWVPELRGRTGKALHQPWTVADGADDAAEGYPAPILDLKQSRQQALDAYERMRH